MAIDNLKTEQFREIVVTDVEFLFDFGLNDSVTLYDGDVIQHNIPGGTIDLILAPKLPGGFPEYISHQISKIISQRTHQRTVRVKIPFTPPPPGAAGESVPPPAVPESSNPEETTTPAAALPPGRPVGNSPESPTRRRKTPRTPRTPRTKTVPAAAPAGATDGRRSDVDSDETA